VPASNRHSQGVPVGCLREKGVWLVIQAASQKWIMTLVDWCMAMNYFIIEFTDRLEGHL